MNGWTDGLMHAWIDEWMDGLLRVSLPTIGTI